MCTSGENGAVDVELLIKERSYGTAEHVFITTMMVVLDI